MCSPTSSPLTQRSPLVPHGVGPSESTAQRSAPEPYSRDLSLPGEPCLVVREVPDSCPHHSTPGFSVSRDDMWIVYPRPPWFYSLTWCPESRLTDPSLRLLPTQIRRPRARPSGAHEPHAVSLSERRHGTSTGVGAQVLLGLWAGVLRPGPTGTPPVVRPPLAARLARECRTPRVGLKVRNTEAVGVRVPSQRDSQATGGGPGGTGRVRSDDTV